MMNIKEEKCLIAYFSREGNNYVGGKIVNQSEMAIPLDD